MIEDIVAQSHTLVDSLTFETGTIGLSVLRTLSDAKPHGGPYVRVLGLTFHEFHNGRCTASLEVKEHLLNPHGIAHGGVTFSLADSASGGAAASALGEARIVTQDMQIRYHGPARPGKIVAQAELVHRGQRTITTSCRVTQNDVLIASVTATFAILSDKEVAVIQGK